MRSRLLPCAALLALALAWTEPYAQPSRPAALHTVEKYLDRVLAVNSGHGTVPKPTPAERAALILLNADVNGNEELEVPGWPPASLAAIKSSRDVRVLMGELRNTGSFRAKARENAREAQRQEELATLAERAGELGGNQAAAPALSADLTARMKALGLTLNGKKFVVAGGKAFDPARSSAAVIAQAAHRNTAADLSETEAVLAEIRTQLKLASTNRP